MTPKNTFNLQLSFTKPPISLNARQHWAVRAKTVKAVRAEGCWRARAAGIGRAQNIQVCLHYRPRDKRRRDPINLVPIQKALVDGLVDAGIVPDDTPEYVTDLMPVIETPEKGQAGACWLVVEVMDRG